jgi:hypothetical protein
MALHATALSSDVLDAKRQLTSDNEWLWKVTVGLRESHEIIEKARCCCRDSRSLLQRLDSQNRLHNRL